MKLHSQEREASVNDFFNDDNLIKKSKSERKYENKRKKRTFKNLVQKGNFEDVEDWEDYLE
jgi:uncharacterized protein with ParB-like and HNH nuclease domain